MINFFNVKKRLVLLALATAAVVPAFAPAPAHAAILYFSGTNTWDDATTADWATVSGGPYNTSLWSSGSDAVFEGTAGTVTVSVTTATNINSILFTTDGYTLSGAGTLNLTGAGGKITMGYGTASNDTISSIIGGTVGLTLNTTGTITSSATVSGS